MQGGRQREHYTERSKMEGGQLISLGGGGGGGGDKWSARLREKMKFRSWGVHSAILCPCVCVVR